MDLTLLALIATVQKLIDLATATTTSTDAVFLQVHTTSTNTGIGVSALGGCRCLFKNHLPLESEALLHLARHVLLKAAALVFAFARGG